MLGWKYKLLLGSKEQQIRPSTTGDLGAKTVPGEWVLQGALSGSTSVNLGCLDVPAKETL